MGLAAVKRVALLAGLFALLVAAIETLPLVLAWWRGEAPLSPAVGLGMAVLAVVAILWWRHSVFAPGRGQCLLPESPDRDRG